MTFKQNKNSSLNTGDKPLLQSNLNTYTNLTEQEFSTLFCPIHTSSGTLADFTFNTSNIDEFGVKNVNPINDSHSSNKNYFNIDTEDEPEINPQIIEKQSFIAEGYLALSNLEIHKASVCFRNARLLDMSDQKLDALYTSSVVWIEKINELNKIEDPLLKGDTLLRYWFEFEKHVEHNIKSNLSFQLSKEDFQRFKNLAISLTYICYKNAVLKLPALKNDLDFKLKIYKCLKLLKKYREALIVMQGLNSTYTDSVKLLSELADCYYLNKNLNYAKLLFREIFFINPQDVHLDDIECPIIHETVQQIKNEMKYSESQLKFWIPVYAYVFHHFTISRELKPIEVHNLQNDISTMEAQLDDHKALGNDDIFQVLPKLLNKYIWLIDHYKKSGKIEDESTRNTAIQLIYSKIKRADPHIYKLLQEH